MTLFLLNRMRNESRFHISSLELCSLLKQIKEAISLNCSPRLLSASVSSFADTVEFGAVDVEA